MSSSTGPRKKTNDTSVEKSSHLYKTDTERGIENLRKQLENPKKIDLDTLRNRLGDTSKPIKYADLVKRMSQENDNSDSGSKESEEIQQNAETSSKNSDNLYKTDTERNMERLKQQLNNPKKINLSQFSKQRR